MKLRLILISWMAAGVLSACGSDGNGDRSDALSVVASFFPVADAARNVGGEFVDVRNLTPAGVEPHEYELTSRDVDRIADAGVVFYVGSDFQPAVEEAAGRRDGPTVDVAARLLDETAGDPHFWLDPALMSKAVDRVRAGLAKADPDHVERYRANASTYKAKLAALDAEYRAALATCARREIVTAHAAFSYLARRYRLEQRAITGVTPDAEPDPRRLADLSDLIRREGVTTVFYEELVPRDFADTLAKDAGVKTDVLNPIEGLSRDDLDAGEDYISTMRSNLTALARALDCSGGD
jgi:zinc transport system substrate-binding protein